MKKKKRPGIFAQLILLVSGIILIPLTLLSVYFNQSIRNYTVDQLVHSQLKSLNQLDQNLARITNELNAMIKSYDDSPEIESKLRQEYQDADEKARAVAELERNLMEKVRDYSWVDCNLVLIGANQTIYSSCEFTPKLSTEVIYNSYWYQKNKADTENINYEIFNRSYFNPKDSSPNIVGIKTLVNKTTNQPYGIAILEIKESYFYNMYKDILEEGETLYLQTETGKVLSTSDRKVSLTLDPKDILLPMGKKKVENPYHYQGKEYFYILHEAKAGIWNIVNLVPLETINLQFQQYFRFFFIVEGFVFVFAIAGIVFIANRIYMPVHHLLDRLRKPFDSAYPDSTHSEEVVPKHMPYPDKADSDSSDTGSIARQKELGKIRKVNRAFQEYEELMEEVNQTVEKLIYEQEARKHAELNALAMQIRPHFLYNTLNSIKCLVWTQEYDKIEPTITSLVNLLRNALNQGGQLITLAQEKENVELFVDILNIRMQQKLLLKWDLEEELMNLKFPSFFLQPLVENSIFHGFDPEKPSLTIIVSAFTEEEFVVIELIDTGIGVAETTLQQINLLFEGKETEIEEKEFHIGLANVYNRLDLNYGRAVSMRMKSRRNQGTMVRIKIRRDAFGV